MYVTQRTGQCSTVQCSEMGRDGHVPIIIVIIERSPKSVYLNVAIALSVPSATYL